MNWNQITISCLEPAVQEIQNSEQTQEIKVSDGMPDVGKVLMAWGQPILRSKEWEPGRASLGAGMMVWVLYQSEDGSEVRCLDAWVPFQLRFSLPEGCPEGQLRAKCLTRFTDARSVSPRKILVRCGLGCALEAFVPCTVESCLPEGDREGVQLLERTYPVRLWKEAGEKAFSLEEDLTLPDTLPPLEQILYCRLCPGITEKKVLSDKVIFRGNGNLHLLYRSLDGQLQSWDAEVPFSQFAQLEDAYSVDAQADVLLCVTDLEAGVDPEGILKLQANLTGQYVITDKVLLSLTEDAYCPGRELEVQYRQLEVPVVLEQRRETVQAQQSVQQEARSVVDAGFLEDFPRGRQGETWADWTVPGSFQLLTYDEEGQLQGATARWEGSMSLPADGESQLWAIPLEPQIRTQLGTQVDMKAEIPIEVTATAMERMPMVTGVKLGSARQPDPDRPSVILRRAGDRHLWDLAKEAGTTMDAIRQANGLQQDPEPGRLLLIPVP